MNRISYYPHSVFYVIQTSWLTSPTLINNFFNIYFFSTHNTECCCSRQIRPDILTKCIDFTRSSVYCSWLISRFYHANFIYDSLSNCLAFWYSANCVIVVSRVKCHWEKQVFLLWITIFVCILVRCRGLAIFLKRWMPWSERQGM